ncbi:MAG: DUF2007 domain-containing protein [Pirellulales bacterium]|nr:DUF2007 domain-containing protein [Pirellulales bacterium]
MAHGDLIEIFRAGNPQEAFLLKNHLEEEGIRATVMNNVLEGGAGVDVLGWATQPRVMVAESDAERARQIALDAERWRVNISPLQAPEPEGDESDAGWPRCPNCGRRRLTACPYCGTAGTDFRRGDAEPGGEESASAPLPAIVLCHTCDEPFRPQYLRRCEWCGHEFADGVEIDSQSARQAEINGRLVFVVTALAAVVVAVAAYLFWLF